jgi:fatty acid amide hydrolase 2
VLRQKRAAATLPRMLDPATLQISALFLGGLVRRGEISAAELVETHIRRIEQVNPRVNAVVADRFAAARGEAAAVDALPATERAALPLAGVPFTVKEMVAAEGMPATYGCGNRRAVRAAADATVVARLRGAGAILLGVTNIPEWGMWYETYNHLYGRTNNPWQLAHTAGGSSGGEAAIVAAGGSAFGVGTDIGGSIRMPAAFCGVYGHKPSGGLVPLTGIHPVHRHDADAPLPYEPAGPLRRRAPYLAAGPFARSAGDLAALLGIMAGPDAADPNSQALRLGDASAVKWRGRRVVVLPAPRMKLAWRTDDEVSAAVRRAGAILAAQGADVTEAPADIMRRAGDIWFSALQEGGGPPFAELLGAGRRVRAVREVPRAALGRSEYSWPALFFVLGELIGHRNAASMRSARQEAARVGAAFDELIGDGGVLLMPVHPRPAPRHNAPVLRPFDFLYTGIFNALRLPATSVPFGFARNGLPLAVQIAARHGADHLTLAAACELEYALPRWRPAPVTGGSRQH